MMQQISAKCVSQNVILLLGRGGGPRTQKEKLAILAKRIPKQFII